MPEAGTPARRRLERAALLLAIAVAAVFLAQTYQRAYRTSGNDFTTYLAASRAWWNGENPYTLPLPFPYIYPPLTAFALRPLASLPYPAAVLLWFVVNVTCLLYVVSVTCRLAASGERPARTARWAGLAVVALMAGIVQNNLLNGQINMVVLALLIAALSQSRQGHTTAAAAALGTAIAVKLTPLATLPYFVLRRQFRLAALSTVFALALCVIPLVVAGPEGLAHLRGYAGSFLGGAFTTSSFPTAQPLTYSLGGVLAGLANGRTTPLALHVLALAMVCAMMLWFEALGRGARGQSDLWIFGAYLVAMLLVSPMSETHHLVLLVPPACLAARSMAGDRQANRRPMAALVAVFAAAIVGGQLLRSGLLYFVAMMALSTAMVAGWRLRSAL